LQVAVGGVVGEVCSVEGEEERSQNRSLRGPCTADEPVRHTVLDPHILWPVGEVVEDPSGEVVIHSRALQLVPQDCGLDGVESTGEIKEHDSHSAPSLFR